MILIVGNAIEYVGYSGTNPQAPEPEHTAPTGHSRMSGLEGAPSGKWQQRPGTEAQRDTLAEGGRDLGAAPEVRAGDRGCVA